MKRLLLAFVAILALVSVAVAQQKFYLQGSTAPSSMSSYQGVTQIQSDGSVFILPGQATGFTQCGSLLGANMNITTDQPITIIPPGPLWQINAIAVTNPSTSLTTAAGGVYTAAAKGGTAMVAAAQVYSGLTTNAANTAGNFLLLTMVAANATIAFNAAQTTLFFNLTTAQGGAATADIRVSCRVLQ